MSKTTKRLLLAALLLSFASSAAVFYWARPFLGDNRGLTDKQKIEKIKKMIAVFADDIPTVTVAETATTSDAVLVDVREDYEQRVSMIPHAITKAQFEEHRDEYKDKKVIAYCTIGYRSGRYVKALRKQGIDAYNLEGSVLMWAHAKKPFIDPKTNEPTKRVHVYGETWNLLPSGYEPVLE